MELGIVLPAIARTVMSSIKFGFVRIAAATMPRLACAQQCAAHCRLLSDNEFVDRLIH